MGELKALLLAKIRETGPMRLSEFMEACLFDPDHGYYCGPSPIGAEGAFTTAPEMTQMFGELIGVCLGQAWTDQGRPDSFTLAELGPGRGTLMADLLRATRGIPGFNRSANVHLVERGPHLRRMQSEILRDYSPSWCRSTEDLPEMPLFLVANEFFDALPIRQFGFKRSEWFERLVGADGDSLVFRWSDRVQCDPLMDRNMDPAVSEIVELRPLADRIICEVSRRIRDFGGLALIVDYGELNLSGDTLQAVRDHRFADPLDKPGTADLTSHVDFGAIIRSAKGVAVTPLLTQGEFLGRMGIAQRAQALAASASSEQFRTHAAAYRRLTDRNEMGTLFKALALHPLNSPTPPGFSS